MPRPRKPVTPAGQVEQAWATIGHPTHFPHMRKVVQRMLIHPERVIQQDTTRHKEDKAYIYRYTPQERGEILAFTWWVHCNAPEADRPWLRSAIGIMSTLYLYSSTTLASLTGIPSSTATKCMIQIPASPTTRPIGKFLPSTVHTLLSAAAQGPDPYRNAVRELALRKAAPPALLERLTGVPKHIQKIPYRGIEFFPEECDMYMEEVCGPEEADHYWKEHPRDRHQPDPGNQRAIRSALDTTPLHGLDHTQTPVPSHGALPPHAAIPGCPTDGRPLQPYLRRRWCATYRLPAAFLQRPHFP